MDRRVLADHTSRRILVRQFVEQQLTDTVLISYLDLNYWYAYEQYSDGYQVTHGYDLFYFESEASAIMFKLKFAEWCSTEKLRWKSLDDIPYGKKDQDPVWTKEGRQF